MRLFGPSSAADVSAALDSSHYLGASRRGIAWSDELGVAVFAPPTSRRLPTGWLELVRWCLAPGTNHGSRQWARIVPWLRAEMPACTTVVSYSDPSVGHTGSLYRACNWLWAPTWLELRPPPSAGGSWDGGKTPQAVKRRWVFPLLPDPERAGVLTVQDDALLRRYPWASYAEPRWRGGRWRGGGGDFKRWTTEGTTNGALCRRVRGPDRARPCTCVCLARCQQLPALR